MVPAHALRSTMGKGNLMTSQNAGGLKPSRRTLVKGAAWSVPVVAVAGTTPAYAASPPVVVEPDYSSSACKHPGNPKWYHFNFCFTNNSDEDVTVLLDSMTVNGVGCTSGPSGKRSARTRRVVLPLGGRRYDGGQR